MCRAYYGLYFSYLHRAKIAHRTIFLVYLRLVVFYEFVYSVVEFPGANINGVLGTGNQFNQRSAKFKQCGKTIICQMALFDWIIMLMRLKVMV